MSEGIDQLQLMIRVMETVINPVNQSLNRHSEAVQMAVSLIQRLAEIYSQEPTRNTIIKELREEIAKLQTLYFKGLDEHDDCCKERNIALNGEAAKRVDDILRKASDLMEQLMEDHEKHMKDILTKNETLTKELLQPVGKLHDRVNIALVWMGAISTVAIAVFFYIHNILSKFETVQKTVEDLAKSLPKG